jgi:hypothetical protein
LERDRAHGPFLLLHQSLLLLLYRRIRIFRRNLLVGIFIALFLPLFLLLFDRTILVYDARE